MGDQGGEMEKWNFNRRKPILFAIGE